MNSWVWMPSISARRWMKRRAPVSKAKTGQTLVIIDVPYMEEEQEEKTVVYTTTSIGIILTPANFITVSAGKPW